MHKLNKTKLNLGKETVRVLRSAEMNMARGAGNGNTVAPCDTAAGCFSTTCQATNSDVCTPGSEVTCVEDGCTVRRPA